MSAPLPALVLLILGGSVLTFALMALAIDWRARMSDGTLARTLTAIAADDPSPVLTTDRDGEVHFVNDAAIARFGAAAGGSIIAALGDLLVQPGALLCRLQNRALATGSARDEVVLGAGRAVISVHTIGRDGFLWRLDWIDDSPAEAQATEVVGLPMLTVARSGVILSMNEAVQRLLGGQERTIDKVFPELPLRSGEVNLVQTAQGPVPMLVSEVDLSAGRREVFLLPEPRKRVAGATEWGVVEGLPVPILKLAPDGTVVMASARARRLLSEEDIVGQPLARLIDGLGRPITDWLAEAWQGRNLGRTETVKAVRRRDETFLQISLDLMEEDGGPALIVVMNDATELKSLENQFVQSQKMQAIGQLAGGIAHDFNNLLTAISGHCDLLLLRRDSRDPDFADLTQISQNANRAAALVSQLLAFSRKQTLKPDVIDLADGVADLSHLLGRLVGERIRIDFAHDRDIAPVRADRRQLEQVVMNLVVNARDAMPEGGLIRLDVRNIALDRVLERDQVRVPPGQYVSLRVIDEGTGIAPDKLTKIFEPFFTTKGAGKGTGLGLSMAYGIVKQSGGYIFVDSVEGSGTTFTLYFPVYHPPAEPETVLLPVTTDGSDPGVRMAPTTVPLPRATHEPGPDRGGTVLLVEDEAPVRAFASRALQLRGYQVIEAENAEVALRLLEDPDLRVDVVVTDVVMPGMDGPTWVAQAILTRPGVKVVFVSGYAEESVSEHQKRIPNSVFLPKPFSLSELTATVSAQIH
ncbi:PAS domain-containing hybrid sensor histidine kinase/response regulator [Maritimibacter sp. DP1N21-5]|uniref:hybrid sensor histidine kinase/response regulator n=1 Tax=Maritimibacter sp. DP1N21-5 TaxID=2836867 RepID=UPI001C453D72|nr:PAS domain-containing hybrid sensor histidine kinase/response regulator [Maritimibacter sp. DP1N21-5]MBV7409891.1 response regulator [Maritimibacter sp. DP1N21-5]